MPGSTRAGLYASASEVVREALGIFAERDRARMEEDGRRRCVAINPVLLDDRE